MLPSEGFVTTEDGVHLFFRTRGQGPHAVIVPNGLYLWDDFEPLANGRLLIFYDLCNRGHSDRVGEGSPRRGGVLDDVLDLDPADADRIDWGRCDLPNERNFMKYWTETVFPSIQSLNLSAEDLARVETPVLTLHGTKDRSAPYGGGREWVQRLPNARLVTVENAGHAPWIEAPERVFGSIGAFLQGGWPEGAEKVESLDYPADG